VAGPYDYTDLLDHAATQDDARAPDAMSVVVHSPLQFLFWYDKPEQSKTRPSLSSSTTCR